MTSVSLLPGIDWLPVLDGDARAFSLFKRHYSYRPYADGRRKNPFNRARRLFVGPGQKMVLMTADCRALFVWRKFINRDKQDGVCCAVFRNESGRLSSALILEAEQLAWRRWPGERLYTYIDSKKVKSTNPGFFFQMAGWRKCGMSKSGLLVLEKIPQTTRSMEETN